MITGIDIDRLRGIVKGSIHGLTRLVVLVGGNGSGKSTVLEACYIAANRMPGYAVGHAVQHRTTTPDGARWLIYGGSDSIEATVTAHIKDGQPAQRALMWHNVSPGAALEKRFKDRYEPTPASMMVTRWSDSGSGEQLAFTAFIKSNRYETVEGNTTVLPVPGVPTMRLIEPDNGEPLHALFSNAVQAGRRDDVMSLAIDVMPGLKTMEVLTPNNEEPRLFLTFAHGAVPASLAGDGIQAMLRLSFELASPAGATLLLEEPEVRQHLRALHLTSKAIVASVRRGNQVILTTHSLELIDDLLRELTDDELADTGFMSIIRTKLDAGELRTSVTPAFEAAQARGSFEEDLR